MGRPATEDDLHAICSSLPEVEWGTSWGDRPTYLVRTRPRPKGFLLYRAPRRDAIDPTTGDMYDDLVVIRVANAADKAALVEDPTTPFFTIDHFNGFNAVLLQLSRIGELDLAELTEVLTDAWASQAPKALVREHLGDG